MTNDKLNELRIELHKEVDARIDKFIEPQFEVGKWYKHPRGFIFNCTFINSTGNMYGYGIDEKGGWNEELEDNGLTCMCNSTARLDLKRATESEVLEALTKEAKRRLGNDKTKCLHGCEPCSLETLIEFKYDLSDDVLRNYNKSYGCGCIYEKGKWAEVIKEKTSNDYASEFYYKSGDLKTYLDENNLQITKKP